VRRLPIVLLGAATLIGLGLLSSIVTQGYRELAEAEWERRADDLLAIWGELVR